MTVTWEFVGPAASRMAGQHREPRFRVPGQSADVSRVDLVKVRIEVPRPGIGMCPRIRPHVR